MPWSGYVVKGDMGVFAYWNRLKRRVYATDYRRRNPGKDVFECPGCGYVGPFEDIRPETGLRIHAKCPDCGALERHRLQLLVLKDILRGRNSAQMKLLHFAPESILREFFNSRFQLYKTADLYMNGVDYQIDLLELPFKDESYDLIFASHVLEHIPDDLKALSEIQRVLKKNGVAILPVPVVTEKTVEYSAPNPKESYHVRAPGLDYFARYESFFRKVELFSSDGQAERYQPYVYEARSGGAFGNRQMPGDRHLEYVPVCYK